MQPDVIEKFSNSTIQHGKYNDRIYVMKVGKNEDASLPQKLKDFAESSQYSKIFAKVPAGKKGDFISAGFQGEAEIPNFFKGKNSALMLSLFIDRNREKSGTVEKNQQVIEACQYKRAKITILKRPENAELRECTAQDAENVARLYEQVFPTYPFPISDPTYILETMASHVVYFGVWLDGKLAALSSAEMDVEESNVEMTDFATLPEHRGQGLATMLLETMETEMHSREIATAYTIARAPSFGMNITFARMGYEFGGTLVNNTNIGGQFEDMNVWYKKISAPLTTAS